ncbi:MAG: NAD-dependent epimerase/dehydratase family protein [Candidatus Omnitrophica bacterium]|nr:NAD-dependent epimerase/dehydratase family protein [Candidatus Omnitrophota bacterium]
MKRVKKVLITGASGFIGANLARALLAQGHEVHVLLRPQASLWRLQGVMACLQKHAVNLQDGKKLGPLLGKIAAEWVFHLATYGAYSSQQDIDTAVLTNITGINHLLPAALDAGCESFVNVGSSSEYGFKDHAPKENEVLEPNSHYALTKAYATMFCRHTSLTRDRHVVSLRPYSVYGPYEEPSRFIPQLVLSGLKGGYPPLVGPGVARDYVYVDDFVRACILAAQKTDLPRGMVFNVGTGRQTTIRQAADIARKIFGIGRLPVFGGMVNREWDTNVWVSDSRLIRQWLGWEPVVAFSDGILKTVEWLDQNGGKWNE